MQTDPACLYETSSFTPSDSDLDFVVSVVAPGFENKEKLKQFIREDRSFRKGLIGNEKLFQRVMSDEETIARISPALLFEILLRRTLLELEKRNYLIESDGRQHIPVFYSKRVASLLASETNLDYLVSMLASFTRSETFVISVRIRQGIWRSLKFNDMDIDSLVKLCSLLDEGNRFPFYKRIADLCLFILGIFPDYVSSEYRSHLGKEIKPTIIGKFRRSAEDYEKIGIMFYKLASEHKRAKLLGLEQPLFEMSENFNLARGCLNFLSEHYLKLTKSKLFKLD